MGLFGGGNSATNNTTNTTTETKTISTIRDIGLTGTDATNIAGALAQASVLTTEIGSETLKTLSQETGASYGRLVNGASDLINSSERYARETVAAQTVNSSNLFKSGLDALQSGGDVAKNALSVARDTIVGNQSGGLSTFIPLIAMVVAGIFLLKGFKSG